MVVTTNKLPAKLRSFQAPARVNIIGEHTDYNDGFVLPTTTALHTCIHIAERADRIVTVQSLALEDSQSFNLDRLQPAAEVSWIEYVKGVAAELEFEGLRLRGADIEIDSTIPLGGGLSSSASLELAVAKALLGLAGESLPGPKLAEVCQRAEHRYAGVRCGIMDQYAVACAEKGKAILLDCRSLHAEQVPIPVSAGFILTDSGVRHRLPDGDYNSRADECAAAVAILGKTNSGLTSLRDVDASALAAGREALGDLLYRRCRHVLTENARVHAAVAALEGADLETLGALLNACHASLRDDFESSCNEVDSLVEIANNCAGVLGSRMLGGGFGGCVLSLARAADAEEAAMQIGAKYAAIIGKKPWMHIVEPADPAQEVDSL